MQFRVEMLFLVVLAFSHALAVPVSKTAPASAKKVSLINPPLKDVSSDKKFFGPPFPADYPDDKRPAVEKSILNKLKGPDQPYPALQGRAEYDADYVKDENSDKGAWKAQMEYDRLRRELQRARDAERAAQARADKEGSDVDGAQKNADDAGKGLSDAEKNAKNAAGEGDKDDKESSGTGEDGANLVPPSEAELEKLKAKVKAAEENLAKEEKEFAECKAKLEEAKKNLAELEAKHDEMEKQLESQTKLWMETKTVRLNLKKAKEEAAHAKVAAAQAKLQEAKDYKEEMDRILSEQKGESEKAQAKLAKEQADVAQAKKDLAAATLRLQKLRGITPTPAKSSAPMTSALSFLVFVVVQSLL